MKTRFRTETGSLYEIDFELKTWARLEQPSYVGAHPLRTMEGTYNQISEIRIGEPVVITGKPLDPAAAFRGITTSHVTDIATGEKFELILAVGPVRTTTEIPANELPKLESL